MEIILFADNHGFILLVKCLIETMKVVFLYLVPDFKKKYFYFTVRTMFGKVFGGY